MRIRVLNFNLSLCRGTGRGDRKRSPLAFAAGFLGFALLGLLSATSTASGQITTTPLNPTGVYAVGEKIAWHVTAKAADLSAYAHVNYTIKKNGLTPYASGSLDLSSGSADITTSLDEPGDLFLEITPPPAAAPAGGPRGGRGSGGSSRVLAGALIDPANIKPAAPRPDDFDAFWAGKIKTLEAVPPNPQLVTADSGNPAVTYEKLTLDNINQTHVYGQLARPAKDGKFPALLILQWAGVYGLQKGGVVPYAQKGWMVLNIEPHDIPFDQPQAFYDNASRTTLADYYHVGNDDRDKSYFLRMYLSAYRAAEYLTSRGDWDGKNLVVMGTSMGGQQTLVMGGLYPKVSAIMACVPSSCDANGPTIGRAAGFPDWAAQAAAKKNPKILETARYYDPENFAYHITCPALVAMGLIDETCPAAGVNAAINQMHGPIDRVVMVNSAHQETNNSQAPFKDASNRWLTAILNGQPPTTAPAATRPAP